MRREGARSPFAALAYALRQGAALSCQGDVFLLRFPDGMERRSSELRALALGLHAPEDRGRRAIFVLSGNLLAEVTSVRCPDESIAGFIKAALRAEVQLRSAQRKA